MNNYNNNNKKINKNRRRQHRRSSGRMADVVGDCKHGADGVHAQGEPPDELLVELLLEVLQHQQTYGEASQRARDVRHIAHGRRVRQRLERVSAVHGEPDVHAGCEHKQGGVSTTWLGQRRLFAEGQGVRSDGGGMAKFKTSFRGANPGPKFGGWGSHFPSYKAWGADSLRSSSQSAAE